MKRSLAVFAAVVSFALATGSASAQGSPTELAQKRFEEGRKLMNEGKLPEACAKFAESDRTAPNGGAVMNLADCLERRTLWEEAHAKFLEAARRAAEAQRPDIEAVARERAKKLESHLPPPVAAPPPTPARGEPPPTRVEPAPATTPAAPAPQTEPAPPHNADVAPEPRSTGSTQRVLGLSAAGAGVIALGVGTVFALSASSKRSDVEAACPNARCTDPSFVTMNDDAKSSADTATIFFVVGGVLAAGGAVIYFTAPSASTSASASRTRLGAVALPGGGAATLVGTW